jgi:hypothetical protein
MMLMMVTGETRTDTQVEVPFQPFDRHEDNNYDDSPHAKDVTPYHAFDGVDHDDHSHDPYPHLHHNNMPRRFRNDMDDDIPQRLVTTSSTKTMTKMTTQHYFSSEPTMGHLVSRLLQPSTYDIPKRMKKNSLNPHRSSSFEREVHYHDQVPHLFLKTMYMMEKRRIDFDKRDDLDDEDAHFGIIQLTNRHNKYIYLLVVYTMEHNYNCVQTICPLMLVEPMVYGLMRNNWIFIVT